GAEASLEILKERRVEINLAIVRAVERAHRRLREPAGRARGAGEHHEGRRLVSLAVLRENLLPLRLRAPEHRRHELSHLIRGRSRLSGFTRAREKPLFEAPPPGKKPGPRRSVRSDRSRANNRQGRG